MPASPKEKPVRNEVVILERLLCNGKEELSLEQAHYFLQLGFNEDDKARMHELAEKNQAGALSGAEYEELQGYAKAGCLLGILQSKARKRLKQTEKNRAS